MIEVLNAIRAYYNILKYANSCKYYGNIIQK